MVDSAGVAAVVGAPPDPHAVTLMRERGLDISGHRGTQLTPGLVLGAPLVLVMDAEQQRRIEGQWPEARGRVHLLGRWGEFEVPDPLGGSEQEFRDCLGLIEVGIGEWSKKLGAAASGPSEAR